MYFFQFGWNAANAEAALATAGTDVITNGGFDTDSDWNKNASWTISGGTANATLVDQWIQQTVTLVEGRTYTVTFTVVRTAGSATFGVVGGSAFGTTRSSSGTFEETFVADALDAADGNFGIYGDGFSGTLDNVSVVG